MFAEYRLNRRQGISGNYCRSTRTEYKRRPRRESRRGSFRVLLTPLTYIPVGDGAPASIETPQEQFISAILP